MTLFLHAILQQMQIYHARQIGKRAVVFLDGQSTLNHSEKNVYFGKTCGRSAVAQRRVLWLSQCSTPVLHITMLFVRLVLHVHYHTYVFCCRNTKLRQQKKIIRFILRHLVDMVAI